MFSISQGKRNCQNVVLKKDFETFIVGSLSPGWNRIRRTSWENNAIMRSINVFFLLSCFADCLTTPQEVVLLWRKQYVVKYLPKIRASNFNNLCFLKYKLSF